MALAGGYGSTPAEASSVFTSLGATSLMVNLLLSDPQPETSFTTLLQPHQDNSQVRQRLLLDLHPGY